MADEQVTGMNYFDHQFLRTGDFETAQQYHLDRLRQHNSLLHRAGIVEGLEVQPTGDFSVAVTLGRAVDQAHREVVLRQTKGAEVPPLVRVQTRNLDEFQETEVPIAGETLSIPLDQVRPSSEPLFITIQQETKATIPSADPGITGNTRLVERAVIEARITPPAGAQLLLAQIKRSDDGKIVDPVNTPVLTGRVQATARLADDSITSAKIAEAVPGTTDQNTNTGTGIKTRHIQDRAVTGDKIKEKEIQENHFTDGLRNLLNIGSGSKWVRLPFLPKQLGTVGGTNRPFTLAPTHANCTAGGASGVMEIPVPAGATHITQLRIVGTRNEVEIEIELWIAGVGHEPHSRNLLQDLEPPNNPFRGAPFDKLFPIDTPLNDSSEGLSLVVRATGVADIFLVAVEFTFTVATRARMRGRRRSR